MQLEKAEQWLEDSQSKLARLRWRDNAVSSRSSSANGTKSVKVEQRSTWSDMEDSSGSSVQASPTHLNGIAKVKGDKSQRNSFDSNVVEVRDRGTKRKFERKEHKELIPLVRTSASPATIHCLTSNLISSQHKRKLRTLSLNPVNDQLFVTSALDGVISLWQLQSRGSGAALLGTTDCLSPKHRRWPEDISLASTGKQPFLCIHC